MSNSKNLSIPENKEQFMDMVEDLRPDLLYPDVWSDDQQKTLEKTGKSSLRTKKAMFANIPMVCKKTCPIKATCPLYAKKQHPLGRLCPIEMQYVMDMAQSIALELAVDPDDLLELSQVRSLVNQEIQMIRAQGIIAEDGFTQENVVGVDDEGMPLLKIEINNAVEMEDRILKRMKELRKGLIADRESKVKAGELQKDSVLAISEMISEERKQNTALLRQKLGVIDAKVTIEESND